jgi:DNA repair protein RadC
MRQRFLASGQDGLFEHELLELILFYARPVVNTNGIAHDLINEFGSLSKVLSADEKKLCSVKGVGEGGAAFLKLINDFGLSYMRSSHSSETLTDCKQLCDCLSTQLRGITAKICNILCLSTRSELMRTITLPIDEFLSGSITPKELAAMILKSEAAAVCIGINHGEELPIPTENDYRIAHFFGELLSAIGISFNDLIICGGGKCFSMRSSGAFTF